MRARRVPSPMMVEGDDGYDVGPREGDEPDYRFTLANERTFLAWNRTALALVAAGAAVTELLPGLGSELARNALGLGLLGFGCLLTVAAVVIWRRNQRAIRLGQPLPASLLPLVLTGGVLVAIVITMLLLALDL